MTTETHLVSVAGTACLVLIGFFALFASVAASCEPPRTEVSAQCKAHADDARDPERVTVECSGGVLVTLPRREWRQIQARADGVTDAGPGK